MTFLNPMFLWALFLVAIPIIIHLFNFRRYTTVYFSQVKFLQNIKKETKSKSQLKNILLLLVRCFAIALLVLAFAKPVFLQNDSSVDKEQKYVLIYIDNSYSMEAVGKEGILLEGAKIRALEIVKGYSADTKFALISNEFMVEHFQFVTPEQITVFISKVQSSHLIRTISAVNQRKNYLLEEQEDIGKHYFYMLSDFQKNSSDFKTFTKDSLCVYGVLKFISEKSKNVWVDSIWFETPEHYIGKRESLMVKVHSQSDKELIDIPVSLYFNDTLKVSKNISVDAYGEKVVSLPFIQQKKGKVNAYVELNDYPVTFDNRMYFNYQLKGKTQLLQIGQSTSSDFLNKLYALEDSYEVTNVSYRNIPYNDFNTFNVIIFNGLRSIPTGLIQHVKNFVAGGGTLFVIPEVSITMDDYKLLFDAISRFSIKAWKAEKGNVVHLNKTHRLFERTIKAGVENLDLPSYNGFYPIQAFSNSSFETLFESESGNALFVHERYKKGHVFLSALPFSQEETNLMMHPIFIPLCYNIAMQSTTYGDLYHVLQPSFMVDLNAGKKELNQVTLIANESNFSYQPDYRLYLGDIQLFLKGAYFNQGVYKLSLNEEESVALSFNNDRRESDLQALSRNEVEAQFENLGIDDLRLWRGNEKQLTKKIKQLGEGIALSRVLVLLVLLLLTLEALILRFLK